jgi:hypothetical protein
MGNDSWKSTDNTCGFEWWYWCLNYLWGTSFSSWLTDLTSLQVPK